MDFCTHYVKRKLSVLGNLKYSDCKPKSQFYFHTERVYKITGCIKILELLSWTSSHNFLTFVEAFRLLFEFYFWKKFTNTAESYFNLWFWLGSSDCWRFYCISISSLLTLKQLFDAYIWWVVLHSISGSEVRILGLWFIVSFIRKILNFIII